MVLTTADATIINRGRGPEIAGTRITVYDVMDYLKHGWHRDRIAALFRLSSRDIQAAIDYIDQHRERIEADYQAILERHRNYRSGMARPLRIEIEDGVYHVTTRGWERRRIVRSDRDREDWLELLDQVVTRCGWRVFAWVLMTNHFHLFVRTPEANLSAGMHDLNSGYASLFNRRYRRAGSLFQGRFKGQAPMVDRGRRQLRA